MNFLKVFLCIIFVPIVIMSCDPKPETGFVDPTPTPTEEPDPFTITLADFQSFETFCAYDWEYFSIEDTHFVAVANHRDDTTWICDSKIYKWNGYTFSVYQTIVTAGAMDWHFFTIEGEYYLALAQYRNDSTYIVNSIIYKWDPETDYFVPDVENDEIGTQGARDWEFFTIDDEQYLAVANFYNGSYDINSVIYIWNGVAFEYHQSIPTHGAFDWEYFTIGNDSYLAVANYYSGAGGGYNIDSCIYKWNPVNEEFDLTPFQEIPTNGATDWESFSINGDIYLAVANSSSGSTSNIKSRIYRWDQDEGEFNPAQTIDTHGAYDWEYVSIADSHYLVVANTKNDESRSINSIMYKWDREEESFALDQEIGTIGALDWEHFTIGDDHFLAVANGYNGSSHEISSVIYKILY